MDDKASTEAISRMLLGIVEAIVDKPEETEIVTLDIDGGTCFRLRVASGDLGKVIGKEGRMAGSIRTVLGAASMKCGRRFMLDIGGNGVPAKSGNSVAIDPSLIRPLQRRYEQVLQGQQSFTAPQLGRKLLLNRKKHPGMTLIWTLLVCVATNGAMKGVEGYRSCVAFSAVWDSSAADFKMTPVILRPLRDE